MLNFLEVIVYRVYKFETCQYEAEPLEDPRIGMQRMRKAQFWAIWAQDIPRPKHNNMYE